MKRALLVFLALVCLCAGMFAANRHVNIGDAGDNYGELSGNKAPNEALSVPEEIGASASNAGEDLYIQERDSALSTKWSPEKERRAREALAKFREVSSRLSAEDLREEQDRIKVAKARMESVEVAEPKVSMITDEHGQKWKRLEYPGGVVRYDFPN